MQLLNDNSDDDVSLKINYLFIKFIITFLFKKFSIINKF